MSFTPINTQEEFDAAISERIKRARETAAKEYTDQIAEKDKKISEFEKQISEAGTKLKEAQEKAAGHEKTLAELNAKVKQYETDSVKTRIAGEFHLPYELAKRLNGEKEEDIRKDAEALSKLITQPAPLANHERDEKGGELAALRELSAKLKGE